MDDWRSVHNDAERVEIVAEISLLAEVVVAQTKVEVSGARGDNAQVEDGSASDLISSGKNEIGLVQHGVALHGLETERSVGRGHAEVLHHHLNMGGLAEVGISDNTHINDVDVVENIGIRSHFRVANNNPHPPGQQVCGCMAFCEVVARSVGWQVGARQANGGEVGFVDVALDAGNAVFQQIGDEGLPVSGPPIEGTAAGGNGRVGDGPVHPIHVRSDGPQQHRVHVKTA